MANSFPLIIDYTSSKIKELPSGDNLDLTNSNISNVNNVSVSGTVVISSPANLKINSATGLPSGRALITDGNGGLAFGNTTGGTGDKISNGTSNVTVTSNGPVGVSVGGLANALQTWPNGVSVGNFSGNLSGTFTGNISGSNITGNLTGNVTGNTSGVHTGNVTGNVTGNLTGNVTGNTSGVHTGNVTGNVTGGNISGNVFTANTLLLKGGTSGQVLVSTGNANGNTYWSTLNKISNSSISNARVEVTSVGNTIVVSPDNANAIQVSNLAVTVYKNLYTANIDADVIVANSANIKTATITSTLSINGVSNLRITAANTDAGKALFTYGSNGNTYWGTINSVGGNVNEIQFNNGGVFAGHSQLKYYPANTTLYTSSLNANSITATTITPLSITLANVNNLKISGGNVGSYLRTYGNGVSYWGDLSGAGLSTGQQSAIQTSDGNGGFLSGNLYYYQTNNTIKTNAIINTSATLTANLVTSNSIISQASELGNVENMVIGNGISGAALISHGTNSRVYWSSSVPLANTVKNNAQPNITSVGTLTGLTVNGISNLTAVGNVRITGGTNGQILSTNGAGGLSWVSQTPAYGNSNVDGYLSVYLPNYSGNLAGNNLSLTNNLSVGNKVTAVYFSGDGYQLRNLNGANVTGIVPNANVANTAIVANALVNDYTYNLNIGNTLTVNNDSDLFDLAVRNNTSLGLTDPANNKTTILSKDSQFWTSMLRIGANTTISNEFADVGIFAGYRDSANSTNANLFMGWDKSNTEFVLASMASLNNNHIVTTQQLGNLRVDKLVGTLLTANQSSITTLGNLTQLTVDGPVSFNAGTNNSNLKISGAPGLGYFLVSSVNNTAIWSNVFSGAVSNANYSATAGTVTNNAQPNITSVGNLTSLNVSGNLTLSNISNLLLPGGSNGQVLVTNGNSGLSFVTPYSNSNVANYLPTHTANIGANVVTANTFSALISFTGNATGLRNIPGANVTGVVANANYAANSNYANYAGNVVNANQPNITSVGTLTALIVNGNISVSNGNINGNIISDSDVTYNIGASNKRYNEIHAQNIHSYSNLFGNHANINTATLTTVFTSIIRNPTSGDPLNITSNASTRDLIPADSNTYTLGNSTHRWKDVFLSSNSVVVGDATLSSSNGNMAINGYEVVTSSNNTITIGNISLSNTIGTANFNVSFDNANLIKLKTPNSNISIRDGRVEVLANSSLRFAGWRHRGSPTSPTVVAANDYSTFIDSFFYDGVGSQVEPTTNISGYSRGSWIGSRFVSAAANSNVYATTNMVITVGDGTTNGKSIVFYGANAHVNMPNTLNVTGQLTANTISIYGNNSTISNLTAYGNTTVSNLSVSGSLTVNSSVVFGSTLNANTVNMNNYLTSNSGATFATDLNVGASFNANGAITGNSSATIANNLGVGGVLNVTGQSFFNNRVESQGYYTVSSFINGNVPSYGSSYRAYNARGSNSSNISAVQLNDDLGGFLVGGYTGNGTLTAGGVSGYTSGGYMKWIVNNLPLANGYNLGTKWNLAVPRNSGNTEYDILSFESGELTSDSITIANPTVPSSPTDNGKKGQIAYDNDYVYICVANNTWKRSSIGTW